MDKLKKKDTKPTKPRNVAFYWNSFIFLRISLKFRYDIRLYLNVYTYHFIV